AADAVIALQVVDGAGDLAKHPERQCIEHLWPVQTNDADRVLPLDDDVFEICHGLPANLKSNAPDVCWRGTLPSRCCCRKTAATRLWPDAMLAGSGSGDEHPRRRGQRQQAAKGDEDFS